MCRWDQWFVPPSHSILVNLVERFLVGTRLLCPIRCLDVRPGICPEVPRPRDVVSLCLDLH